MVGMSSPALLALLVAAAVHAGFQLTVTTVVYPALVRVPDADWAAAHAAHGRAITPIVAVTYPALAGAGLWAVLAETGDPWVWCAGSGAMLTGLSTAVVAAPTHGALARGRTEDLLTRLLVADRVRTAGALIALVGAVLAVAR